MSVSVDNPAQHMASLRQTIAQGRWGSASSPVLRRKSVNGSHRSPKAHSICKCKYPRAGSAQCGRMGHGWAFTKRTQTLNMMA